MTLFGEEPICTCPDMRWEFNVVIDEKLVASDTIKADPNVRSEEEVEREVRAISARHFRLAQEAHTQGKTWVVEAICPSCRRGGRITPDGPVII